jgi:hypothetical protein
MADPDVHAMFRRVTLVDEIRHNVGPCREWVEDKLNICGAPTDYILWGKLIDPDGLGPRCYEHAALHVGHHSALAPRSGYALINVMELANDLEEAL